MQSFNSRTARLLTLMLFQALVLRIGTAQAQPCYSGFKFRVPVILTNAGSALSQHQIEVKLNTSALVSSGKMNSLGRDIRFLNKQGDELNYWIADGTMNSTSTSIWVLLDTLGAYAKDTVYLFYGNTSATAKSDASKIFAFYDDFNGSTLSSAWTTCGGGTASVSGGGLTLSASSNTIQVKRTAGLSGPLIVEASITSLSGAKATVGQVSSAGTGYGASITTTSRLLESFSSSSCYTGTTLATTSSSTAGGLSSFVWVSTGSQISLWPGGTQATSSTAYSQPSSIAPFLGMSGGTGSVTIDFVRARKYTASVPSIGFGPEANMNFTISPTYRSPLCESGTLELIVDSVPGAVYSWTGPNSFKSSLQNPKITGVTTNDAGRYDITVNIPMGCASKSSSVNVNISPKAKGGVVSGTQTVCSGANSGVLSLSGHTGNVLRWDSAYNASGPWYPIANTQLNQNYSNLTANTYYRAIVTNGNCSQDSATYALITVTSPSKGGSVGGNTTVCYGSNSGTVTVSGYTGNIVRWESSENGNLWSTITNKGTTQNYSNLIKTTHYRAVAQNGNCNVDYSTTAVISVDQPSVGGSVSGSTTVCPDNNSGTLMLSGHRGSVVRWESKGTGSWTWQTVSQTSDTLTYSGLSITTAFRAVVRNGACSTSESSTGTVTVYDRSSAGTLSGGTTVCEGSNSGTVSLSSTVGSIVKWQSSTGSTWTDISSTSASYNWYNLSDTTSYRAIVSSNGCNPDTSNAVTVVVHPESLNGYISGTSQVCVSGNLVQLGLSGHRGSIEKWERSETGYTPWTDLGNTTTGWTDTNLTKTQYYRVTVKNGVCPKATTSNFEVVVDALTVAGKTGQDVMVCEGNNFGIVTLSNSTGSIIKWQKSTDLTGSWTDISNTTSKQEFQNLNNTTYYRSLVQSGSCKADTSNHTIVSVSKNSVAGTLVGEAGYCTTTNSGHIGLTGYSGDIQFWEVSTNNGDLWNKLTTNQSQIPYLNLDKSTWYRVTVKSGACAQLTSNVVLVEIAKPSNAGTLTSSAITLCKGSNFGTVNAGGVIGNMITWQLRTENGNWTDVQNTSAQQSYFNLEKRTGYRTIAQNRFCAIDTSEELVLNISQPTEGGVVSGKQEVCSGEEDVVLALANHVGDVIQWEHAATASGPWSSIQKNADQHKLTAPTATTYVRVKVMSGVCPSAYSNTLALKVYEKSKGGITSGTAEICSGNNAGTVTLTSYWGNILNWQSRNASGVWTDVAGTLPVFEYSNLGESTELRAVVKNGVCAPAFSNGTLLNVHPNPMVDVIHDNLCDGRIVNFKQNTSITEGFITSYSWSFSDGFTSNLDQFDRSFNLQGKYQLTLAATSSKGCQTTLVKDLQVGENPVVFFKIKGGLTSTTGCLNQGLLFDNETKHSDIGGLEYTWDFGDGRQSQLANPVIEFGQPGSCYVTLTATARTGCIDVFESNMVIFESHKPVAGADVVVSKGIGFQLSAFGSVQYLWEPAEFLSDAQIANPIATIASSTEFVVTGTDYYGCKSKDSVMLTVVEDYMVIPNNVITPDGNGGNDVWIVKNIESYPNNEISVFDRWGREVFQTTSYQNDWGATNQEGGVLMDGTYYYVIEFPDEKKVLKGAITVIQNR